MLSQSHISVSRLRQLQADVNVEPIIDQASEFAFRFSKFIRFPVTLKTYH